MTLTPNPHSPAGPNRIRTKRSTSPAAARRRRVIRRLVATLSALSVHRILLEIPVFAYAMYFSSMVILNPLDALKVPVLVYCRDCGFDGAMIPSPTGNFILFLLWCVLGGIAGFLIEFFTRAVFEGERDD